MKKHKKVVSPYVVVRKSSIHSRGAFAKKDIPKGTRMIEYVGDKITKAESDRRAEIPLANNKKDPTLGAVYMFTLNKRYDIDGSFWYNTAKYINHSCHPNCETDVIHGRIWIISLRDIKKGEELTYNYGYDIDDYEDHPCLCRTHRCVGYILDEDHWGKLKRREKTKALVKKKKKKSKTKRSSAPKKKKKASKRK